MKYPYILNQGLQFRGTPSSWRNEPTGASWSPAKVHARFCTGDGTTLYRLDNDLTGWSFAEQKFKVLINNKFNMSQHCAPPTAKANCVLGWIRKSIARRSKEIIIPLCLAPIRPVLKYCVHFGVLHYKRLTDWRRCRSRHGVAETGLHGSCTKIATKCQWYDTRRKASTKEMCFLWEDSYITKIAGKYLFCLPCVETGKSREVLLQSHKQSSSR